jgi:hypothetical protein
VNLVTIKTSANKLEAIEAQLTERIILLKFQVSSFNLNFVAWRGAGDKSPLNFKNVVIW